MTISRTLLEQHDDMTRAIKMMQAKPSKMRNQKIWECPQCGRTPHGEKSKRRCGYCGGKPICHASKKEYTRWHELKLLQKQGLIRNLERQCKLPLLVNGEELRTPKGRFTTYVADFAYDEPNEGSAGWHAVYEDVKGRRSGTAYDLYWIKREILRANGIEVKEI